MKILFCGQMLFDQVPVIARRLSSDFECFRITEEKPNGSHAELCKDIDAIVTECLNEHCPAMPRLRLLQVPLAGMDKIHLNALSSKVTICNVHEHEVAVAEYAIGVMLAWSQQLLPMHESFRRGEWNFGSRNGGFRHRELWDRTVGIIGFGRIGRAIAERASALGMTVIACNRSCVDDPGPAVRKVLRLEELDHLLADSDFVVVSIALTPETAGLIGRRELAQMRQSGVLINVARGVCVDEDALFEACVEKRIAGAVIDSWYYYPSAENISPRPSRNPFWEIDNVIMTPHAAAWTEEVLARRLNVISSNIMGFARGAPLLNVVRLGYLEVALNE
jgi:phosphoglycerate dehydrogenase-like enzyme